MHLQFLTAKFEYVTFSFGLNFSAFACIFFSEYFPSPSPNSIFTLIVVSTSLWERSTTVSTCFVCGNISTGCIMSTLYPPLTKISRSLACVCGLHEIYTILDAESLSADFRNSTDAPAHGGSINRTSAFMPSCAIFTINSPASSL